MVEVFVQCVGYGFEVVMWMVGCVYGFVGCVVDWVYFIEQQEWIEVYQQLCWEWMVNYEIVVFGGVKCGVGMIK